MKALALISGGLDSLLSAKLIQRQGIEVLGIKFNMPFCSNLREGMGAVINVKEFDITELFLRMLLKPRYGYGSNINPCLDCKILMLRKAKELMDSLGASFVITGEVLGQRPMSQHRRALELIEGESGLKGFLVRPLSAKLLAPTIPEQRRWVSRELLMDISGRSRKPQLAMARDFGLKEYKQPAGGCLLTDPEFSKRLKDSISIGNVKPDDIEILKLGRYFCLGGNARLIVGRNEKENEKIFKSAKNGEYLFMPKDIPGPTALGKGRFTDELIMLSCAITMRYSDLDGDTQGIVLYKKLPGDGYVVMDTEAIEEMELVKFKL